jgi:hypothetical protein
MNMVEQVARAICNSVEADDFDALPDGIVRAAYMQQARAAIEAMRELTPEMKRMHGAVHWTSLIDEALNTTQGSET